MSKRIMFALVVLSTLLVIGLISCKNEPESSENKYRVGDRGPAGGLIVYDCDEDNKSGNADGLISSECGWRYLEAAPADLRVVDGIPTIDSSLDGYSLGTKLFPFGYYRTADDSENLFANGTSTYNAATCTKTAIGSGKTNTRLLVDAMGTNPYSKEVGSEKVQTNLYSSLVCDLLVSTIDGVVFDDWFLPSKDELFLLSTWSYGEAGLTNMTQNTLPEYISSSELIEDPCFTWYEDISANHQAEQPRRYGFGVHPFRAF